MSQTFPLSPSFERARKLSRVMAVVFTVGFWMALAGAVVMLAVPFIPLEAHTVVGLGSISVGGVPPRDAVGLGDIRVSLNGLSFGQRTWVLLAMEIVLLPIMLLMHHTRRVFGHFAKAEIFVLPVIGHVRSVGLWLIVSFFANIGGHVALVAAGLMQGQANGTAWPLVIGMVTFIAAYVMEEARRIAAYNAEIV
jgi:hypothetical protein